MPNKTNNQKKLLECDRYDFAIFSLKRLLCTLRKSHIQYMYISIFFFIFFDVNSKITFFSYVFINPIGVLLVYKINTYMFINCYNNPNCNSDNGLGYEKGFQPSIKFVESRKEKNDN